MSFAYRFACALLVAGAAAICSTPAMSSALPDPRNMGVDATSPLLPGPYSATPPGIDSAGVVNSGYRSMHFESSVGGSTFPFQVTVDNDHFFFSDYSAGTVLEYQLVGGGANYIRTYGAPGSGPGQFSGPAQVAVVGNYIYVADYFNARIQRFDKTTGSYVSQFGSSGAGTGQLNGPSGLIYNPITGLLYVSETGNDRVQAFNLSGVYQSSFGSLGTADGQLSNPFGLAVDSVGNIYVADTSNNRISKFDPSGAWMRNVAVGATSPYAVAIDSSDNVWVTFGAGDVYAYNSRGSFLTYYYGNYGGITTPTDGYLVGVRGIAVTAPLGPAPFKGAPVIIVADGNSQSIQLFTASAQPIAHPAMDTISVGGYNNGIAYDSAENVYVTDFNGNQIYKFDKFGVPITQWGSAGSGNGQFNGLMGIAIDDSDNVYVADRNNNRIQKFTAAGVYVTQWGTLGTGNGQFNHPAGVATDGAWLYVTEEINNRVQKFSLTGTYVRQWGTAGAGNGQFNSPEGIAVDRNRNQVYVSEYTGARVQQFTVFGDFIKVFADSVSGSGQLAGSLSVAVDQRSNVYASDLANNRVVQYSDQGTYLSTFSVLKPNGIAVDRNGQIRVGGLAGELVRRFGTTIGKTDTIGVYRPSTLTFYLRNSLAAGAPDITATVTGAAATDIPITGDWNGDGVDTPGLWRPITSTFYLWDKWRGLSIATAPYQFAFGANGDRPIVGDWDGDGRDGIGVFRPSSGARYLKNNLIAGPADNTEYFGAAGDTAIAGDWNQDGNYTAGVYRPGNSLFYLTNHTTNTSTVQPIDAVIPGLGGGSGDLPFTGDWTRNGSTGIGLFRAGIFYVQLNVGSADGTLFRDGFESPVFSSFAFGINGDIPLGGSWGQAPE